MIVKTNDQYYKDIASAIRQKNGSDMTYKPSEMATAIESIPGTEMEDLLVERPSTFTSYRNDRVATIGNSVFYYSAFKSVVFPNATSVGSAAFWGASKLSFVHMPKLETMPLSNTFYGCVSIEYIKLPSLQYMNGNGNFSLCSKLVALILGYNGVCNLAGGGAFVSTPIASGTGYIYVPDELVEQYKVATNWALFSDQIKGLSEIPAEVQQWLNEQEAM